MIIPVKQMMLWQYRPTVLTVGDVQMSSLSQCYNITFECDAVSLQMLTVFRCCHCTGVSNVITCDAVKC